MKTYIVFNIKYDTDGQLVAGLPKRLEFQLPNDVKDNGEVEDALTDAISDKTGWCHKGYDYVCKDTLMEQLRIVDNQLSPENLCCDGEASATWVRREGARLRKERTKIIKQLGYEPTVQELYPALTADLTEYKRKKIFGIDY